MNVYAGFQKQYKTPIYCGADSMVKDGGFATYGIDYDVLATQVAQMTDRILKGGKISDNPVEQVSNPAKLINKTVADEIGIKISDSVLAEYTIIG